MAGFAGSESVDTGGGEIAGFALDSLGRPRPRTGIPAAFRWRWRRRGQRKRAISAADSSILGRLRIGEQRAIRVVVGHFSDEDAIEAIDAS